MSSPMRVSGISEFGRGMRELERVAPGELDAMVTSVMEDDLLRKVQDATPEGTGRSGTPGRLRASTRVAKVRGRPGFVNRRPYANTIHWGRKRRGEVRATRFVWDVVIRNDELIEQRVGAGLNRLLDKHLP